VIVANVNDADIESNNTLNLDGTPVDAITGSGTAGQLAEFSSAGIIQAVPLGVYAKTEEAIAYAYIFG